MPTLTTVTAADVIAWFPCCGDQRVRDVLSRRQRWNALDILSLDIPIPYRQWAIHRDAMLPRALWQWLCCDYAGSVVAPGDVTLRACLAVAGAASVVAVITVTRAAAGAGAAAVAWAVAVAVATARAARAAWQVDHARTLIEGWRDWPDDDVRGYLATLTPVEDWTTEADRIAIECQAERQERE